MKMGKLKPTGVITAVLLLLLLIMPVIVTDPRWRLVMAFICLSATMSLGLYFIARLGLVSFAQAGFSGLGAYCVAFLLLNTKAPFWIALPAAGVFAALMGALIGLLVLKMKGAYFFLVTLALNQFIVWVFHAWKGVTGGYDGLRSIPLPPLLGSAESIYYLALGLLALAFLYIITVERSRFGVTLRAVAENDSMVQSYGVSTFSIKMTSWIACCFFTGLAGGISAILVRSTFPTMFDMIVSLRYVVFMVFGGLGSPIGPIIGVVILMLVSEAIRAVKELEPLVYGVVLVLTLILLPGGLISLFDKERLKALCPFSNLLKRGAAKARTKRVAS